MFLAFHFRELSSRQSLNVTASTEVSEYVVHALACFFEGKKPIQCDTERSCVIGPSKNMLKHQAGVDLS